MAKKEEQQVINDLKGQITAYQHLIRVTRSDMQNAEFVNRTIAEHEERIRWHQKMIEDMQARRENAPQIIEQTQKKLKKLRQKVRYLEHKSKIERMLKLQAQIDELEAQGIRACEVDD